MSTKLSEKIFTLRKRGLSYRQIVEKLDCSKGSVAYHLGKGQKEKAKVRRKKWVKKQHPYKRKIEYFCDNSFGSNDRKQVCQWYKLIRDKIKNFSTDRKTMRQIEKPTFTVEDVIEKFGENPRCYLTGDPLDIYKPRTYHFDHVSPVSKDGDNSIDNLGICTKSANQAKSDMTIEQFVELCKKVVKLHSKSRAGKEI